MSRTDEDPAHVCSGQDLAEAVSGKDPSWYVENLEGIDWDQIALVVRLAIPAVARCAACSLSHIGSSELTTQAPSLQLDRRTATDCRIQWTQRQHPLLRPGETKSGRSNFTKDELERLCAIVEERGVFGGQEGWAGVAKELKVRRRDGRF